jgi:hypothetical protein
MAGRRRKVRFTTRAPEQLMGPHAAWPSISCAASAGAEIVHGDADTQRAQGMQRGELARRGLPDPAQRNTLG